MNSLTGQGIANAAKEENASQVEIELNHLEASIERVDMQIGRLENRVQSVLRSSGKPEGEPEKSPEAVIVPLADRVRILRKTIDTSIEWLSGVIGRIEL